MPRLWAETVESHRQEVRDKILDTVGDLVQRRGSLRVSMSMIAKGSGIGRATLYKYFPDVHTVLAAWHLRHVEDHLRELTALRDGAGDPSQAFTVLLTAYARIARQQQWHGTDELAAVLHRDPQVLELEHRLHALMSGAIRAAVDAGTVRRDVPVEELASYCIDALAAARTVRSEAALRRLVMVVRAGLAAPQKNS